MSPSIRVVLVSTLINIALLPVLVSAQLVGQVGEAKPQSEKSLSGAKNGDWPPKQSDVRDGKIANRRLQNEDLKTVAWRSVGPANMGGRVADIAIAPGNAKTFYVGFGTSGLFKTTNNGTTFAPLFDKESTASIGSVVVCDAPPDWAGWKEEEKLKAESGATSSAPVDPEKEKNKGKAKIVWVGTGEGNGRNSSSWGNGVYRSTDGGGTFTNVGLNDSHDIPRMAVDPRNPDVCYVAALGHLWGSNKDRGVYRTRDGGKTWSPVLQIDENTGAIDVLIDPKNPNTVYAAMYMRRRTAWSYRSGGPQGGIYRSDDAGATWKKLGGGLPSQTGRIGLDIYLKDPRILYAIVESDLGGTGISPFGDDRSRAGGLYRSDDHGDTWKRVNIMTPRAFYFSKVRVDPGNDQRVYVLGFGLAVSDDGGRTFRAGGARKPHGDLHAMVIDPLDTDHLLLGTDGGVYVSYDRGATWEFLDHLAVGEFYDIAVDKSDPYRISGGLQDNGSWVGPSATILQLPGTDPDKPGGGMTNYEWQFINDGDGFHVAFDPDDRNIMYAESQGGNLVRIQLDTGLRKQIYPSPKEGQPRFRFNWNTPFFVSPHNSKTLYCGGNCVFKLTERGDKWERISEDLSTRAPEKIATVGTDAETHGTVVSLAESPIVAGMLWAGTDDGLVQVTSDDGSHWQNVTPKQVGGRYISKVEPSHHARGTAYVSADGHRSDDMDPHVLLTDDSGQTWSDITGDLPKGHSVKCVREDLGSKSVLYAGTENAAYVTVDRGAHWARLNGDSLPTVSVDDIVQHPREKDLVAGTHGRSIWVLDDASYFSQLTPDALQSEMKLFDIRPAKPVIYIPYGGLWSDRLFTGANPPMGARITYWIGTFTDEAARITITDSTGATIRSLGGSNRPGINRVVWDLERESYDRGPNPDSGLGQKQFVPAGKYKVTLSLGKLSETKEVEVLAAPGDGQGLTAWHLREHDEDE